MSDEREIFEKYGFEQAVIILHKKMLEEEARAQAAPTPPATKKKARSFWSCLGKNQKILIQILSQGERMSKKAAFEEFAKIWGAGRWLDAHDLKRARMLFEQAVRTLHGRGIVQKESSWYCDRPGARGRETVLSLDPYAMKVITQRKNAAAGEFIVRAVNELVERRKAEATLNEIYVTALRLGMKNVSKIAAGRYLSRYLRRTLRRAADGRIVKVYLLKRIELEQPPKKRVKNWQRADRWVYTGVGLIRA